MNNIMAIIFYFILLAVFYYLSPVLMPIFAVMGIGAILYLLSSLIKGDL